MIGTRSLQWGAVVMTTRNIQKAVVATTLPRYAHALSQADFPTQWLMTSQRERTASVVTTTLPKRNNWRVIKPDSEKQGSKGLHRGAVVVTTLKKRNWKSLHIRCSAQTSRSLIGIFSGDDDLIKNIRERAGVE
jgi:hypothetical protein